VDGNGFQGGRQNGFEEKEVHRKLIKEKKAEDKVRSLESPIISPNGLAGGTTRKKIVVEGEERRERKMDKELLWVTLKT